ncbi:hypothetical protein [Streptococcus dysgalactiae]|uniref:hypothetical protein n=1 Tax=Streptococcus dysgalactiae TaxID=1334 RepID=UPI0039F51EEE
MFKHLLKQDLSWQGGKDSPIKWYFGLGLLIFYHIGTIIVDQLAVTLIPKVYQNVEPGTVPYQEFLNTTPLPLIIGQYCGQSSFTEFFMPVACVFSLKENGRSHLPGCY